MRVMVMLKATRQSEAGARPPGARLDEMRAFTQALAKAGVLLAGDGLHPSDRGKRVHFAEGKQTIVDGPFAETRELVAGYWIWQVGSMDEALMWAQRCPAASPDEEAVLELRPLLEPGELGGVFGLGGGEREARRRTAPEQRPRS